MRKVTDSGRQQHHMTAAQVAVRIIIIIIIIITIIVTGVGAPLVGRRLVLTGTAAGNMLHNNSNMVRYCSMYT